RRPTSVTYSSRPRPHSANTRGAHVKASRKHFTKYTARGILHAEEILMATALRSDAEVERLVRDNRKLVEYMVNRYLKRYYVGSMDREDLVSWGMMGLVNAARAFDPARSRSFSTLACRAIERMIIRGVNREWHPEREQATVSLDQLISG